MDAGGRAVDGGESESDRRREKRAELEVYIRMAFTFMAYLAFTWSTVVLLGGYVSSLQRKDFACLTAITVVEATRPTYIRVGEGAIAHAFTAILASPVLPMFNILLLFNFFGPIVCIGLSSWRLRHRDYQGHRDKSSSSSIITGEASSLANLTPGLDFFYVLVLCQCVLYCFLICLLKCEITLAVNFSKQCKFPEEWRMRSVRKYLQYTRKKCARDPAPLAEKRTFLSYAAGLLESESQEEFLWGARMLDRLITDGEDASSIILRSNTKIQRLVDKLGMGSTQTGSDGSNNNNIEMRVLAARIVAHVASGIQLTHFPEAIRSVSSLLETTVQPLWNNSQRDDDQLLRSERRDRESARRKAEMEKKRRERKQRRRERKKPGDGMRQNENDGREEEEEEEQVGCNELILQGLRILEGLTCDPYNCTDICAAPGLLAKITVPLYSATLIQDVGRSKPWADIANSSLKVVHHLITHAVPGTRLRHEISSNKQAVSNLQTILDLGTEEQQVRAMEIFTQLVLYSSVDFTRETRENLVRKQLQSFVLADGGEVEVQVPATNSTKKKKKLRAPIPINKKKKMNKTIKATAGETLSILSSKSEAISMFIVREHNDIVGCLIGMLDAKYNTRHRTISAEILENLFTHCKEHVDQTFLQKVLDKIQRTHVTEVSAGTTSARGANEENRVSLSQADDEEMQCPKQNCWKAHGKASKQKGQRAHDKASDQENEDEEADMKELQEALLSLTLVMRDKLIEPENFALVIEEKVSGGGGAFVNMLKAIVDDNCQRQATPVSLRIIKLCGQIAKPIMRCNSCTTDQKKEFVKSLTTATNTMANIESCVLFTATDCGTDKTARPLLSDIEKQLKELVP
uniref:Uncharacterized protein n=1 Tax=Oryza punctata TaxID=4537 RepID=A0A0E0MDZ6_ORYPU